MPRSNGGPPRLPESTGSATSLPPRDLRDVRTLRRPVIAGAVRVSAPLDMPARRGITRCPSSPMSTNVVAQRVRCIRVRRTSGAESQSARNEIENEMKKGERRVTSTRSRVPAPQLPPPETGAWAWQARALCRGVDSSVFFPPDGERGHARARREARAKDMCRRCPVMEPCRVHALTVGEPYGVWGGLSESERQAVTRESRDRSPATRSPSRATAAGDREHPRADRHGREPTRQGSPATMTRWCASGRDGLP